MRTSLSPLLLAAAILVSGCVTTQKRYDRAQTAEGEGDYLRAAREYVEVLRKDRHFADARRKLEDVGARALAAMYVTAEDLEATGAFELAVRELDRMESLRRDAEEVRVILTLPPDFAERHLSYTDAALDALILDSEEAMATGNLDEAMRLLGRARDGFELDDARRADLDQRLGGVLIAIAREDLNYARPKAAYDTALRAIEVLDAYDNRAEEEARALAEEALAEGIRVLAIAPLWRTEAFSREAPEGMRADINDAIAFGEAGRRSEFIALLDPGQTRRAVRAMGLDAQTLTRADLREIASELGADFVLTGEAVSFLETERIRRSRDRSAQMRGRGGADTTYTWQQVDVRLSAVVEYRVYELASNSFVLEGDAEGDAQDRFERASFAGNWRSLDLSGSQQLLFDPEEWARQERQLMIAVADQIAERAMRRVEDQLERRID